MLYLKFSGSADFSIRKIKGSPLTEIETLLIAGTIRSIVYVFRMDPNVLPTQIDPPVVYF